MFCLERFLSSRISQFSLENLKEDLILRSLEALFDSNMHITYKDIPIAQNYIYIYIYPLSRCITTLQYGSTREIVQAEIKTRLTLRQSDILLYGCLSVNEGIFYVYLSLYMCYRLPEGSIHKKSDSAYVATGKFPRGEHF